MSIKICLKMSNNEPVKTSHRGGRREEAVVLRRRYLSPALDVIHSRPWHKLDRQTGGSVCAGGNEN